jgi:hypothetical protein
MKKVKNNKVLFAVFYNHFNRLTTDKFKTDEEMERYRNNLKPAIKEKLGDYIKLWDKAESIKADFLSKKIDQEKAQELLNANNSEFLKLDMANKNKAIEIELEDSDFNLLVELFNRIGKEAFKSVDSYLEFKDGFNN